MRASDLLGEDWLSAKTDADELFEMANLSQEYTGVPGHIYVSSAQGQHGPRVKVVSGQDHGQRTLSVRLYRVGTGRQKSQFATT